MRSEGAGAEPMVPRPYRVTDVTAETHDVATLVLEPIEDDGGQPLEAPRPGQFNMLWVFGVGEVPISVSSVREGGAVAHTVRSVGTVSNALVALVAGGFVGVRGPFGHGWDVESAAGNDVMVVGGGIGFAPLRPVVEHLLAHRDEYGRITVLLGARTPDDIVFGDDLAHWSSAGIDVEVTVDAAGPAWRGHVGVVTDLIARAPMEPARSIAFVCGPETMMRFATRELHARGVPLDRIRLSAERNMKCAVAHCGHCQLGDVFVCREGPVLDAARLLPLLRVRGR